MRKALVFMILTFIGHVAVSQNKMSFLSFTMKDTASFNEADTIIATLQNVDTSFMLGIVELYMQVNGGTPFVIDSAFVALQPGDTTILSSNGFAYLAPTFDPGINIVVVWPASPDIPNFSGDTLIHDVFIRTPDDTSGIHDNIGTHFGCFPTLARPGSQITCEKEFEQVRIYTLDGRSIYSSNRNLSGNFYVPQEISTGFYVVEILRNGERFTGKIFIIE